MSPLPRRTLWAPIWSDTASASTARSTTRTVAPAMSASALIAAPPRVDVGDHLGGHLRRIGRHPGPGDAVVTGEHHHPGALELSRRALPLARRDPYRQVLEAAQRAPRLGQGVLAGAGGGCGARVGRRDRREPIMLPTA